MEIAGFTVGQLSTGSLLLIVVACLIKGWLVPRRVMTERLADRDADNERLREENRVLRQTVREDAATVATAVAQQSELLAQARTTNQVLESLARPREVTARVADPA